MHDKQIFKLSDLERKSIPAVVEFENEDIKKLSELAHAGNEKTKLKCLLENRKE